MLCLSAKAQQLDVQLVPHIYTGGTHITCHGQSNGQVAAIITGGQAPYKILWSTGDTTNSISGLPAGSYSVMVHDAAFDTLHRQITLTQPASLAVQFNTSSYNGYAVAWQSAANAHLQVLPTGGVAPYKILWADGDSSMIRSNLSAGNYAFTLTDAAGCTFQGAQQLHAPEALHAQVQVVQQVSCHGEEDGRAVLTISGGVPPYTYQWKNGETTDTASSLAAGQQHVVVKDANQKTIQVQFQINQPEALEVNAKAFVYANKYNTSCHNCANGKIMTNVTGGTAPYTYAWYNDEEELISTESNPEQLEAGKYYLSVYDAHQCKAKSGAHILPAPRDDWSMEGNEGLDAGIHFIGTTDSTALVFRTNYQEAMRIEGDGTVKVANKLLLPEGSTGVVLKTESGEIELLTTEGLRDMIYQTIQLPCVAENPSGMPDWQREVGKIYTGHPICRTAVGINTSSPTSNLQVIGSTALNGNLDVEYNTVLGSLNASQGENSQPRVTINSNENKALVVNSVLENDGKIAVQTVVNRNKTKAFAVQNSSTQEETFVVYGDGTIQLGDGASDEAFLNITSTDKNAILVKHQDSHADPSYSVVMGIDVDRIQTKAFTVTKNGEQEVVIYGDGTAYFGKGASLTAGAQLTKLAVDGKFGARSMIVLDFNQAFPDYVFEETYCVDDLETTFNWVKKFKHLPGVTSQEEVNNNGYLDMGKLQLQMLEKIEELYIQVYKLQLELNKLKEK